MKVCGGFDLRKLLFGLHHGIFMPATDLLLQPRQIGLRQALDRRRDASISARGSTAPHVRSSAILQACLAVTSVIDMEAAVANVRQRDGAAGIA
ncbi:MAG: hypothetical protein R2911_36320 [Caldilineaceae bacterium]